ncbi:MAG: class I SAM-dependent DNA methyltransferase [Paracholeplasma sp.]|nr:class I SAM-dependent DNA methyltransferase [Paracholeplasma sp.]MDY3195306.1 class I SAM-dependent DNA methyltransferase [Paracholeplasma sp.]
MITGELKNKIDNIWETFWTGGLSNPLSVIEQVTYLLFIKLIDDNQIKKERNATILGVEPKNLLFKTGNYIDEKENINEPYINLRWSHFKNFEPQELFNTVKDKVFPFIKQINNGKDTAFSRYMKDAVFMVPTPRVLLKVVDGLDALDLNNKDIMGDVYEYLLAKIASSGTNGQFRTPRHIIRMMVELMKPTLNDVIADPAMGSAGFIVESARYIHEHYSNELLKAENQEKYTTTMFSGYDTDQTMLRIGAMNMMLHGVDQPDIKYQDSLSEENVTANKFSLILANPPFKGSLDYEAVSKDLLAVSKTKKTELLFLAVMLRMLKVGGRAATVVPDGVLFGSSNAHKAIRKELVDNHKLVAVISMPSGVFKPYAGVSTAIVIFIKTNTGGTDNVWFYNMEADGYTLDDKRSPVDNNDIDDIINRFHNLDNEVSRTRLDKSFFVDKKSIIDNDYDLSINKYIETKYEKVEYDAPSVIMNRIDAIDKEIELLKSELKTLLNLDL